MLSVSSSKREAAYERACAYGDRERVQRSPMLLRYIQMHGRYALYYAQSLPSMPASYVV